AGKLARVRGDVWLDRAEVFVDRRALARAGSDLDRALAEEPRLAEAWWLRGDVRARQGRLKEALADFNRWERHAGEPDHPERCYSLAVIRLNAGDEAGYREVRRRLLAGVAHRDLSD